MVRPLVEYATCAWSPYTNRDVSKLEQAQKNAARIVANNYEPYSSSSSLVSSLNWTSLENRRFLAQAHMFCKIRHNPVNISFPADVKENPRPTRTNPHKYKQLQCNVLSFTYMYSFFPQSIRTWNSLPVSVSSAKSLDKFKSASALCINTIKASCHLKRP